MNERRAFLKKTSLLPLGLTPMLSAEAEAESMDQAAESGKASAVPPLPAMPPPPEEQPFTDYHLLGNADSTSNLLGGGTRPGNWKDTKARVKAELSRTAQANDPIHEWLKTFLPGFDERSSGIILSATAGLARPGRPMELRYEPQIYDISLRSSATQLDRCLRYRNEMGGFEMSGVNTGIGYLAFLKSKPIQRNLIVQSGSADVDQLAKLTESRTGSIYAHAHGISRLFEKYHLLGLRSDAEGEAIEAEFAGKKERLRTHLLEKQFHIQVDTQMAELTRLLSPGSASDYAERYLRILNYLSEDLTDVYCKLYSAAKGIQQVLQLNSLPLPGGGTAPIDIPAFTTTAALNAWIQQIIPTAAGGQRQPDILDAFVIWSRAVMRELDRRSQYETELTVAIPLNQPSGRKATSLISQVQINTAFLGAQPTGQVTFALDSSVLPFSAFSNDLRVVGIGLTVERSQDDASPVQYTTHFANAAPKPVVGIGSTPGYDANPPASQVQSVQNFLGPKFGRMNATLTSPRQTVPGGQQYQRPGILLANVRLQGGASGDLEPVLSYDPACRNLNPYGSWAIQIDPNVIEYYQSASTVPDNWITGLILYLRVRGTVS